MKKRINQRITKIRNMRKKIHNILEIQDTVTSEPISGESSFQNVPRIFFTEATSLQKLKVAAIMDRFTLECFRPECSLTELTPDGWEQQLESQKPDLLFIESAWEGKDGLWHGKINHCSIELYHLTDYCHAKNIPVVFWNKEDPVFTDTFIPAARLADFVFTTDIECIEKYKTELGHNRVYHMHFAAQPRIHNPIEKYERKNRFCFAGAYYHRYADRCRIFDAFSDYFIESRGLDIYDRNYGNARPEHKFPERYDPYILGTLDPSEIDIAYKGYVYGINMNSITQSQTMFARRVFELMASNTIVIGNYSRGVKNYFGDLTFCTDDEKNLRAGLERYCNDKDSTDKLRLLALRKVLTEHLCEDRLDYIVQKVFRQSLKQKLPTVCVWSRVSSQDEADRILAMFGRQSYPSKHLLLVSDETICVPDTVRVIPQSEFEGARAAEWCQDEFLACFSPRDWYGENYLLDLALTTRYGTFDVIGKGEFFTANSGTPTRQHNGAAYRSGQAIAFRRGMVSMRLLYDETDTQFTEDYIWTGEAVFACDAMNYCECWPETACPAAEDLVLPDQGISMEIMEQAAQNVKPIQSSSNVLKLSVPSMARMKVNKELPVQIEKKDSQIEVTSSLPDGTHCYLNLEERINVMPYLDNGELGVLFRGESRMNLTGFCIFYDRNDQKLSAKSFKLGVRGKIVPPPETAYMKIAYRAYGPGTAIIRDAEFGANIVGSRRGGCFLSRSNVLVLTNQYPSPDDLYRNMFVHKRVTSYKDQNTVVDVMRMNPYAKDCLREFEGINVIEGQGDTLASILGNGIIDTVCVHFLSEDMWEVLKKYTQSVRIVIWLHGAEIQPWWRREYNYQTEDELNDAKAKSEKRMTLWHAVFEDAQSANIHFIFVSQYFADEVCTDYQVTLPTGKYSIVHNCIDTEQFDYVPKKAEDRKKLLSIRPYASMTYANDLTVKAILELSKEAWFEELEIALYGSGPMFEDVLAPLQQFSNVKTEKKFLTQREIAVLHKEYGIFLIPTRMDTQGVSRDEAMSSGLVPVTNAVAAIPEFVSEDCGILAPGEDFAAMAEGIKQLYHDPDRFLKMSENAAKRVRSQSSREHTIDKELQLICCSNKCEH